MICTEKVQLTRIDEATERTIVILTSAENQFLPKHVRELVQKDTVFEDASIKSFFTYRIDNKQVYIVVCYSMERGWPENFPEQLERVSRIINTIDDQNIGVDYTALPPDDNTDMLVETMRASSKRLVLYNKKNLMKQGG